MIESFNEGMMPMKRTIRFTRKEKSWILYDWANSVYATNMMAAIFPIYFGSVCKGAGVDNVVPWSYGTAVATFTIGHSGSVPRRNRRL